MQMKELFGGKNQIGWVCPKCESTYNPSVNTCHYCYHGNKEIKEACSDVVGLVMNVENNKVCDQECDHSPFKHQCNCNCKGCGGFK